MSRSAALEWIKCINGGITLPMQQCLHANTELLIKHIYTINYLLCIAWNSMSSYFFTADCIFRARISRVNSSKCARVVNSLRRAESQSSSGPLAK